MMFWGTIEGAARDRATTADLWSRLQDHADTQGLSGPGLTLADVNALRARASDFINSERNLARANDSYGIDSSMIATAPWERPMAQQDALPMYQVRFEHHVTVDGVAQTQFRTVMFRGELPATVGDLMDELEGDAQEMADNYGQDHGGIGAVTVMRV
jgi:hypothetical protein